MYHLPRIGDQIRVLAKSLGINEPQLLILAREAAGDAKLRSLHHLEKDQAELLLDALQIIKWTRALAKDAKPQLQWNPCQSNS